MSSSHDLQEVAQELVLAHALRRAPGSALLHNEGDEVTRLTHLVRPCGFSGGNFAVSGAHDGPEHVVEPVHGEQELTVGLERQPAQGNVGVCEKQNLAHCVWGEEDVIGLVEAAFPLRLAGLASVESLPGFIPGPRLDVVEVNAQDHCPHYIQDGSHECVYAVEGTSLAVVIQDTFVEETADILSLVLEDWLQLADALQREGIREHSSVSAMFGSLHENEPMACDFLYYSEKPLRLGECVTVVVQNILVHGETIWHQDLCVEKAEIADERSVGMLLHPFNVQRGRSLGTDEIETLTEDEIVVLGSSQPTCQ